MPTNACELCDLEFGSPHPCPAVLARNPQAVLSRKATRSGECLCCDKFIQETYPEESETRAGRAEIRARIKHNPAEKNSTRRTSHSGITVSVVASVGRRLVRVLLRRLSGRCTYELQA